jgi:hypothetical protein
MERVNAKPNTRVKITFPDEEAAGDAAKPSALDAVAGCLKWSGRAKTVEEMDEAIARGAKERSS